MLDPEKGRVLVEKCLANATQLFDSAKDMQLVGRSHIAYHLAVLALEEVGKASMILMETLRPIIREASTDSESTRFRR